MKTTIDGKWCPEVQAMIKEHGQHIIDRRLVQFNEECGCWELFSGEVQNTDAHPYAGTFKTRIGNIQGTVVYSVVPDDGSGVPLIEKDHDEDDNT